MNVIVVREYVREPKTDMGPFRIVMVARTADGEPMISPVVTIEGYADGNPYGVYGDAVAEFTGRKALDCNITVAECRSGDLGRWGDDYDIFVA